MNKVGLVAVAALLCMAGCANDPATRNDAAVGRDGGTVDAGLREVPDAGGGDAGSPGQDAGALRADAGALDQDAGGLVCASEPEPTCDCPAPACRDGEALVVRDGCWQCVSVLSCEARCGLRQDCSAVRACD